MIVIECINIIKIVVSLSIIFKIKYINIIWILIHIFINL